MNKLHGQTVVIIGGSSGMGLACARLLLQQGCRVHLVARAEEKLSAARQGLCDWSAQVSTHSADLGNEQQLATLFSAIGAFDHLVLSASGSKLHCEDIRTEPLTVLKNAFDSKVWGYISAIKQASVHLAPTGSIVLFSGGFSVRPGANTPVSTAANLAIEGLVISLAKSLTPVRINAIRPGLIDTPLTHELISSGRSDALVRKLPIKRVGAADDIARGVSYLLASEYVTGTVLTIDGGYVIH